MFAYDLDVPSLAVKIVDDHRDELIELADDMVEAFRNPDGKPPPEALADLVRAIEAYAAERSE